MIGSESIAAVLVNIGQPLEIYTLEIPSLARGQVLVKVLFSGVCRSQVMEVSGGRGEDSWLPHLLGHEGVGIVVDVGKDVTKVKSGDEVILGWIKGDGIDAPGAQYTKGDQVINAGRVTTFSNYSIVSESRVVKKPKELAFDEAVLFGCALPTGAGMVLNEISPTVENSVVVLGLGGIGLSALMMLKALDIQTIIAADISTEKLKMAKSLGATHALNTMDDNFFKSVQEITFGGADYCIESAGKVSTIELGFSLIKKSGQLLFASHPPEGEKISLLPHELISGKRILGSWGGATQPDRDIPKISNLLQLVKTPLNKLFTKRYRLEQINDALDDLDSGKVFRPLIVMSHNNNLSI